MTFGNWPESVHDADEQKMRMARAASSALTPIDVDYESKIATFSGHHGIYKTSLDFCSCVDFGKRHLPCKHIYRLAHEILHIDLGCTVMNSANAIVQPDIEDRMDKAIRIGMVIDKQPKNSYISILNVLCAIKGLGRLQSTIDSAIEQLEIKIQKEESPLGISQHPILFSGKAFVLTGEFSLFTRKEAIDVIEKKGAKIAGSLSSKTNYLIIGKDPNTGKLKRAEAMGIPMISEQDFHRAMQQFSEPPVVSCSK